MSPLALPLLEVLRQVLGGLGLDPEAKARAQAQAFEVLTQGDFAERSGLATALAQLKVNEAEASSPGLFRGGWRPGAGWVCVVALGVQFVVAPLAEWGAALAGHPIPPIPKLDAVLWELLFGLLGLGALRTIDKRNGRD